MFPLARHQPAISCASVARRRSASRNLNPHLREPPFLSMGKARVIRAETEQCKESSLFFSRLSKGGIAFSPLHPRPPRLSGSRWRAGGRGESNRKIHIIQSILSKNECSLFESDQTKWHKTHDAVHKYNLALYRQRQIRSIKSTERSHAYQSVDHYQ